MMDLQLTHHGKQRIRQRGLSHRDANFVVEFGTETNRGYVLSRKDAEELKIYAKYLLESAQRLCGKFVACDGKYVITAFHSSDRQQRSLL
jgi:hypothetical protein